MLQKVIDILKTRWPEVMLVVVLHAALMLFSDEFLLMAEAAESRHVEFSAGPSFLLGFGIAITGVILQMLYLGFMKTSAVAGTQPWQPLDLIRYGRRYFWKILFFQIMFGFVLLLFSMAIATTLGRYLWKTEDMTMIPEWFFQFCTMAAILFMIKPFLLVPARMIVYDNSLAQSVLAVPRYRFGEIESIFKVLAGGFGIVFTLMFLIELVVPRTVVYFILTGVHHVCLSMLFLVLALMAVLWLQDNLEAEQAAAEKEKI